MGGKLGPELTKAQNEALVAGTAVRDKLIEKVIAVMAGEGIFTMFAIEVALNVLENEFTTKKAAVVAVQKEIDKYNNLHFLNIEGPGYGFGELTDAQRVESYDIIVSNLKALGLHCCGEKEAEAEAKIREGLTFTPPKKTK